MSDERITDLILQRLENIERKIDCIQAQGCSKADSHLRMQANEAELFSRINALERAQAEGRGKLAAVVAILSAASGLLFAWIGKHLT
jgi:septal ring factor EnvC (AmiA/AmiB activator)